MRTPHTSTARVAVISGIAFITLTAAASAATDPGVRSGVSAGDPLPGLTADETALFMAGQTAFAEVEGVGEGLGPRFNLDSCLGCHAFPIHGGSSPPVNPQATVATAMGSHNSLPVFISANGPVREARFKFTPSGARDGGVHSLFVISGRTDATGNATQCTAVQEDFNTQWQRGNVSLRIPTPTFGAGLIESIADTALVSNLAANGRQKSQLGISGHLNTNGNDGRVARFGWKAQNVSLLMFAGEAYNVEMGITNELFPTERDLNATCQTASTPNDVIGKRDLANLTDILDDIDKFALFMRFLAPPVPSATTPGGSDSISRGRQAFGNVGCGLCHTPSLTTDATAVAALANKPVPLYSDLALHHMGPKLADNILQGAAGPDEFRTAPLWGLGQRVYFLHDGRSSDLVQAIEAHASSGSHSPGSVASTTPSEANQVIANFEGLNDRAKQDLLNFLRSL
ncbi:MAG TPA: di-heme oxidoredictase family protein [Steroidobacteraceae bacterium]|nr:di-heme oxidoredictase family protein [Steroidobacteraceae bacterium]